MKEIRRFEAISSSDEIAVTIIEYQQSLHIDEIPGLKELKTLEGCDVNDNKDGTYMVLNHSGMFDYQDMFDTCELIVTPILSTIESAFLPFRCVAETWDYDGKIKFKVFNSDNEGIHELKDIIPNKEIRNTRELKNLINDTRLIVEEKGFSLEPWNHPINS